MNKCLGCGYEGNSSKYCPECGTKMEQVQKFIKWCTNCNKELIEGGYCSECGGKLIAKEVTVEEKNDVVGGACPNCEFDLHHGHQPFCPGCGKKLIWHCRGISRGMTACTDFVGVAIAPPNEIKGRGIVFPY